MRDFLIAVLILGGGFGALQLVLRKNGTEQKDEVDPEAPRNLERTRAASEAKAAAPAHLPLSDADAEAVAELHEYFKGIGTGEHPTVSVTPVRRRKVVKPPSPRQLAAMRAKAFAPVRQFEADPLGAPIPGRHRVAEPVLFGDAVERFFTPALPGPAFPEPPAEPEPWQLGGFTDTWTAADVARMVAEAKAGAQR